MKLKYTLHLQVSFQVNEKKYICMHIDKDSIEKRIEIAQTQEK